VSALLSIAGLIIGIALFFYILSLYNTGKEKLREFTGEKTEPKPVLEPKQIVNPLKTSRAPGSRICPLCGSTLTKYEALYASFILDGTGKRILIHGCRHCYKPDEDPDTVKRSAL